MITALYIGVAGRESKMNLVLRDSIQPEFGYALVLFTIFICLWTIGAYYVSHDLQESIMIKTIGGYSVIDSDSWKVFLIPDVIFLIITVLCFRLTHKESKN